MLARDELPKIKTRSYPEATAKRLNDKHLPHVNRVLGVAWYSALSKVNDTLTEFFRVNGKYFFIASLMLTGINWLVASVDLAFSANKNAGKMGNYLYTTLYLLLYLATAAIFTFINATVGGAMLVIAMFMDPLANLGRAVYFGIRAALESDKSSQSYCQFANRSKSHLLVFALGLLASAAFVILMFMPALPIAATIAIGAMGATVVLLPYLYAGFLKLKSLFGHAAKEDYLPAIKSSSTTKRLYILGDDELLDDAPLLPEEVSGGYYENSIAYLPESWQSLRNEVNAHIAKLEGEIAQDTRLFIGWFQESKRLDKINALRFLDQLIAHFEKEGQNPPASATEDKPYRMAGYLYHYIDKNELIDKVAALILQKYPGAFQSFFKEIGKTEACFNQLFLCIITDQIIPSHSDNETRIRHAV